MRTDLPEFRLQQLSDGQRAVLELVAQYKSSKEIARELGISPSTVDQRVKRILFLLGVASRTEAARVFVAHNKFTQGPQIWGDLVYPTSDLPAHADLGEATAAFGRGGRHEGGAGMLHQPQAYFAPLAEGRSNLSVFTGLLEAGRQNNLTPFWRTVVIVATTFMAMFAAAAAVAISEGLSRLY